MHDKTKTGSEGRVYTLSQPTLLHAKKPLSLVF